MALACEVLPISAFQSTNLSSKIDGFGRLGDRIKRSLGYPLISIEIHQDQLFENIQIAAEMFTKWSGYTQEYLVFDSNLYEHNKGLRLDLLFTLANTNLTNAQIVNTTPPWPGANFTVELPPPMFVATSQLASTVFTSSSALSSVFTDGIYEFEILPDTLYSQVTSFSQSLTANFRMSQTRSPKIQDVQTTVTQYANTFDYDVMEYRKVIDVTNFEEGSTTGINTLFTLEQTLAQQTYFSHALGNFGFDLISWHCVKEWMETREKLLAIRRDLKFDDRTQYLQLYPQPKNNSRFYGVISCYVERPLRDIIKEPWVYQYALALSKITVGRVRGKFTNVQLLGGGTMNVDLLNEGLQEKKELEENLYQGLGAATTDPALFFVS